jgi:hypothetical protein
MIATFQKRHQPVISVDAKKKELIGNYKHEGKYPIGIQVSEEQLNSILIERDTFHGEWNYQKLPSQRS